MLKGFKATKGQSQKLIIGLLLIIFFLGLSYVMEILIASLFLGDYNEAQRIMSGYSIFHKILLVMLGGGMLCGFYVIASFIFNLADTLFKD